MGKNVAVFVDVANIFYAAKAAGVDIDYVTLLKSATAGRDLVRAYAYTGLDPDNENQRNFHEFLRRSNYKVVSKDIRKYGDGKVKANLDIELVVDMMKTARNLDIAIVVSGDGDFAPAIRAVQEMGVRCEVISFRGNTSSDLIEVADQFTDIVQLARVEKGSRSGRRVAEDDADLSMTEVPDKLTEGTGSGRGGRSRSRGRFRDEEPAAAGARGRRDRGAPAAAAAPARAEAAGTVVALPGERLARAAGGPTEADLAAAEVFTLDDLEEPAGGEAAAAAETGGPGESAEAGEDGEPRRRRRRGGRGRGRGRGRAEEGSEGQEDQPEHQEVAQPAPRGRGPQAPLRAMREEDEEIPAARRTPRSTPFGSVWDSQLGTPVAPAAASLPPLPDDEEFDEPEIPEYLIAEQRRGANRGGGGRGGPRGGRSAYQSAMDRERYGRGGGGGINRYPDVSARTRPPEPRREDRGYSRPDRTPPPPRTSNEPWSDVPPELEAMLRAQVAQKPVSRPVPSPVSAPAPGGEVAEAATPATGVRAARKPSTRTPRTAARTTPAAEPAGSPNVDAGRDSATATAEAATATPKRRPGRPPKSAATLATTPAAEADASAAADPASPARVRAPRKPAAATGATAARATAARRTPKAAATAADAPSPTGGGSADAPPAAKRRTTRRAATTDPA
ncbi:MAG: NYN domain-containing protein [Candidatus Limnocylindrales bacterium]